MTIPLDPAMSVLGISCGDVVFTGYQATIERTHSFAVNGGLRPECPSLTLDRVYNAW